MKSIDMPKIYTLCFLFFLIIEETEDFFYLDRPTIATVRLEVDLIKLKIIHLNAPMEGKLATNNHKS